MFIGHVGDSRAYVFRDGRLGRLTRDHTAVQAMIAIGLTLLRMPQPTRCDMCCSTSSAPPANPVRADIDQFQLAPGDQVLLSSDGLSDMIADAVIAEVLGRSLPAADACQVLVDLALEAGGKDNVTVVLGHYHS